MKKTSQFIVSSFGYNEKEYANVSIQINLGVESSSDDRFSFVATIPEQTVEVTEYNEEDEPYKLKIKLDTLKAKVRTFNFFAEDFTVIEVGYNSERKKAFVWIGE